MDNMKNTEENDYYIEEPLVQALNGTKKSKRMKKTKEQKWKRIFFGCVGIVVFAIVGLALIFSFLKSKGESHLKAEEQYITYNGEKYKYRQEMVNVLCLGIDKEVSMPYIESRRGNIGMSDAIVLVSVDTKKNKVKAIAIPRETTAEVQTTTVDGELGSKEKMRLCIQYAYGVSMQQSNELTVEAVSKLLYGVQIQRCCAINMEAVPIINDAIGGVDVEVLEDIEEWEPRLPYGEKVHLEGELASKFITVRNKNILEGSKLRTERQKQYISAFVEKAKKVVKKDPTIPITIFQELQKDGNMCTDVTAEDIAYLMPKVLKMSLSSDIVEMVPGEAVVGADGRTEYQVDTDAVKKIIIDTFYEKV